jgi:hypothetical protein
MMIILLTAGCSKAAPSVVAYVDGSTITQQQLDDAVAGVSSILQEGQSVSNPAVVNVLIHGIIADKLAAANKITITDSDRDALIKNSNLAPLLNVPAGRPVAYDVADQQIVSGQIGQRGVFGGRRSAVGDTQPTLRRTRSDPENDHQRQVGVIGSAGRHPNALARVPLTELERLVEVMARLRQECPWDAQQTHRSLVQYLVEEAAETIEAIELGRPRSSSRGIGRSVAAGDLSCGDR